MDRNCVFLVQYSEWIKNNDESVTHCSKRYWCRRVVCKRDLDHLCHELMNCSTDCCHTSRNGQNSIISSWEELSVLRNFDFCSSHLIQLINHGSTPTDYWSGNSGWTEDLQQMVLTVRSRRCCGFTQSSCRINKTEYQWHGTIFNLLNCLLGSPRLQDKMALMSSPSVRFLLRLSSNPAIIAMSVAMPQELLVGWLTFITSHS